MLIAQFKSAQATKLVEIVSQAEERQTQLTELPIGGNATPSSEATNISPIGFASSIVNGEDWPTGWSREPARERHRDTQRKRTNECQMRSCCFCSNGASGRCCGRIWLSLGGVLKPRWGYELVWGYTQMLLMFEWKQLYLTRGLSIRKSADEFLDRNKWLREQKTDKRWIVEIVENRGN